MEYFRTKLVKDLMEFVDLSRLRLRHSSTKLVWDLRTFEDII